MAVGFVIAAPVAILLGVIVAKVRLFETIVDPVVEALRPMPTLALLQLTVGDQTSTLSRYADDGDLHTVIFVLRPDQFAAISATDLAFVSYDPFTPTDFWEVGSIDPSTAVGCDQSSSGG